MNHDVFKLEIRAIRHNHNLPRQLPAGYGVVAKGQLAAMVEIRHSQELNASLQRARRYQEALAVWWQNGLETVLPVRAGSIFNGPGAVAEWLEENATELEQSLTQLEDKVELGLRLLIASYETEAPKAPKGPGRGLEYMQFLAQREAQMTALETIVNQLGSLAENYKYEAAPAGAFSPRAAFLVRRDKLSQFVDAVQQCSIRAVMTGPIPPFSFV
jgi:hypothetical protein